VSFYYSINEAINAPHIPKEWVKSVVTGREEVCRFVSNLIIKHKAKKRNCLIALDGFLGVDWENILSTMSDFPGEGGLRLETVDFGSVYKSSDKLEKIVEPYLTIDPTFGFVFEKGLEHLLDLSRVEELRKRLKDYKEKIVESLPAGVICYGCGAALPRLRRMYDYVFYVDITREELFNRSTRKPVYPLGPGGTGLPAHKYPKRLYYVDFVVLNRHKKYLLRHMDWYIDGNRVEKLKLVPRDVYGGILSMVAEYPFRIKPLYYPVAWGGTWHKKTKNLPESMVNSGQACITPWENSIRIRVDDIELEMPFLNLMWKEPIKIMGEYACKRFDKKFPMAYYYDDGYGGGNMAIQDHPNSDYIKRHFNEPMRQDESYYILYTGEGAKTYLGLKEDADVNDFRRACVRAEKEGLPFDHDRYVNSIPTKPSDYFLIPAGTIHASGRNQVVLEIDGCFSAYGPGYTFHFYDYLRPDLDSTLRAIHTKHAFNVLRKNRRTKWVVENLNQVPRLIRSGEGWAEYVIGERKDMFFKVHRLEFSKKIDDDTVDNFHVLTRVEGEKVKIQSPEHPERSCTLSFTETLIVPACLGGYSMLNLGSEPCKVTKALPR